MISKKEDDKALSLTSRIKADLPILQKQILDKHKRRASGIGKPRRCKLDHVFQNRAAIIFSGFPGNQARRKE